jgi:hypothetical protein
VRSHAQLQCEVGIPQVLAGTIKVASEALVETNQMIVETISTTSPRIMVTFKKDRSM